MSDAHTRQEIINAYCEAVFKNDFVQADCWWKLLSLPEFAPPTKEGSKGDKV